VVCWRFSFSFACFRFLFPEDLAVGVADIFSPEGADFFLPFSVILI
jgi:hypothetical protein